MPGSPINHTRGEIYYLHSDHRINNDLALDDNFNIPNVPASDKKMLWIHEVQIPSDLHNIDNLHGRFTFLVNGQ